MYVKCIKLIAKLYIDLFFQKRYNQTIWHTKADTCDFFWAFLFYRDRLRAVGQSEKLVFPVEKELGVSKTARPAVKMVSCQKLAFLQTGMCTYKRKKFNILKSRYSAEILKL